MKKGDICVYECARLYLGFPLKDDHSAPLVPRGQELSGVVELDGGDDIGWGGQQAERQR